MPGALMMTLGTFAYSLGFIDPVRLTVIFAIHWVIGWIYLFISPLFLPRNVAVRKQKNNPFAG